VWDARRHDTARRRSQQLWKRSRTGLQGSIEPLSPGRRSAHAVYARWRPPNKPSGSNASGSNLWVKKIAVEIS